MSANGDSKYVVGKSEELVVLNNCQGGIGIKIVGGKTSSGSSYGIFIKKTIPGSPAVRNGSLREGDKIVKVNNDDFHAVSNERAMSLLLNASRAGVVAFLIERSEASHREYVELMGTLKNGVLPNKYASFTQHLQHSTRASPTTAEKRSWVLAGGRMSPMSPGRSSPRNIDLPSGEKSEVRFGKDSGLFGRMSNDCVTNTYSERPSSLAESNGDSGLHSSSSTLNNLSHLTVAHIPLTNGLGMSITGGLNHADGPSVTVKELISGGDVYCDGQIKQGDQIVSINGESFLNVTHEEAKMKLTQIKLRTENDFEITYVGQEQFGVEQREKGSNKLGNGEINQLSTLGRLASGKKSETVGNQDESKQELGSQSLKAQTFDENGNYKVKHSSPNDHFSSMMQASIQPSSIPFYLQQDLAVSPELPTLNSSFASQDFKNQSRSSQVKKSPQRRLSLAPASKLRVEKLEVALSYLGIRLTPQQREEIRGKLHVDANGLVSYGEFVNVAQEVLSVELQDHNQTLSKGKLQFALYDIEKKNLAVDYPMPNTGDTVVEDLKRQRDDAIAEVVDLRRLLDEKKTSRIVEAEQLENMKKTAEDALEESMVLKDQVYLATQVKIEADRKDEEYEEVIRMLEDELRVLKAKGTPKHQEFQDLQKKVIVLGCQLRKIEVVKRTYEVVTEKLLSFADRVHDCLKKGNLLSLSTSHSSPQNEKSPGSPEEAPSYLSQRHGSQKLADEARDLVRGVRVLLEEEPLPFGWEEAYTSEGERYFINHVTQVTSWLHPVSRTTKERNNEI